MWYLPNDCKRSILIHAPGRDELNFPKSHLMLKSSLNGASDFRLTGKLLPIFAYMLY